MASEDSAENHFLRNSSILAVSVDRVGKLDELDDAFECPLPTLVNHVDGGREDLVVVYTRREAHVAAEEERIRDPAERPERGGVPEGVDHERAARQRDRLVQRVVRQFEWRHPGGRYSVADQAAQP